MGRRSLGLLAAAAMVASGAGSGNHAVGAFPALPATNDDGTLVTGEVIANFDPSNGIIPFPNNLLLAGTTDLTINAPVADANDFGDPVAALNSLDGFSTVAPASTTFSTEVDPTTVIPGGSVRVFEVSLTGPGGAVTGVIRELTGGAEFVATLGANGPDGATLVVVPLVPLQQLTTYLVVVTDDVTDVAGNDSTPSQVYFLSKRPEPLVDANGVSTVPLLDSGLARSLEPLRRLVSAQEAAVGAAAGIPSEEIVISWTFTTQSITPTLQALRSLAQPQLTRLAPTGLTTAAIGGLGAADIYVGTIDLPYYLGIPESPNDPVILREFFRAEPGAYVPPFDAFGLDPTSTFVTVANPIPVPQGVVTVPVLVTVPSGQGEPGAGWPTVIYQHGVTRNRTDALAVADAMAGIGHAVVAIDQPLHGVTVRDPAVDPLAAFNIENTPLGAVADERTFDVDLIDNATGAPGPDGVTDPSGAHFINLASLLTSRDNFRQTQADLLVLTATIPTMDLNGDGFGDFDSVVKFAGQSLGAMAGIPYAAVSEDELESTFLSVPGGGIPGLLLGSQTFGDRIRGGLAALGVVPGTPEFDQFFVVAQTVTDPVDPINWATRAAAKRPVLLHEVIGDTVIPNAVPGFPLSGTEPLIRVMGLEPLLGTTQDPDGLRVAGRFTGATHGSLIAPAPPEVRAEMQLQAASFIAAMGLQVFVDAVEFLVEPAQ